MFKIPNPFNVCHYISKEQHQRLSGITDWLTNRNAKAIEASCYHEIKPVAAEIVPSENCTFSCPTCAYANKKSGVKMDEKTADVIIERIVSDASIGHAVITGLGDPLTNPEVSCHLIKELKDHDIATTLYTNGYLLVDNVLSDLLSSNVDEIRVSINTLDPQNYAKFHGISQNAVHRTKQNLINLLSEKRKRNSELIVGISFIVTELNRPHLEFSANDLVNSILTKYSEKLLDYIIFRPALNYWNEDWEGNGIKDCDPDIALDTLNSVRDILEPHCEVIVQIGRFQSIDSGLKADYGECLASGVWLEVGATGKVYHCCEHLGDENWIIGDLIEDDISSIYSSQKRLDVLETANKDCSLGICPNATCKPAPYNRVCSDIEKCRIDGKLDPKVLDWLHLNSVSCQVDSMNSQNVHRAKTVAGEIYGAFAQV